MFFSHVRKFSVVLTSYLRRCSMKVFVSFYIKVTALYRRDVMTTKDEWRKHWPAGILPQLTRLTRRKFMNHPDVNKHVFRHTLKLTWLTDSQKIYGNWTRGNAFKQTVDKTQFDKQNKNRQIRIIIDNNMPKSRINLQVFLMWCAKHDALCTFFEPCPALAMKSRVSSLLT